MATIAHPETGEDLNVEIIDTESHRGNEYCQIEAEGDVSLSDQSGDSPWVPAEEVEEQ